MRPPPLSDEERRARNRRIVERNRRLAALIEMLVDRLPPPQMEEMTMLLHVGEPGYAMQTLSALLVEDHIPIDRDERDAFEAVLRMFRPVRERGAPEFRHIHDQEGTLAALNVQEPDPATE